MKEELFKKIIDKYCEYSQCAIHISLRGMRDVKGETKLILDNIKKDNLTWKDLLEYLRSKDSNYDYEKDNFFKMCKKYLS